MVLDVTGTWETVMTATERPVLKDELRRAGMTVQAHVARGMHAVWGGNVAGEMLEWYRRELATPATAADPSTGEADWPELMAEAAASPAGARGVMFLPHMSAAACPVVDPRSLGAFVGLGRRATRGDMLRAIDRRARLPVPRHRDGRGVGARWLSSIEFVAVGGATRNSFWMQNKADVVGRPIEVPDVEEATPLGAAILAGIGVGLYRDEEDALQRVYRPGKTYEPDRKRSAQYAEWFAHLPRPVSDREPHQPSSVPGIDRVTGKERILAALRRRVPDAVPTFEWFIDASVGRSLTGSDDPLDIVERLDLDGINVRPDYRRKFLDETTLVDEWGIKRQLTGDCLPAVRESPINEIRNHRDYEFPDPEAPQRFATLERALERFGDEKAVILNLRDGFSDMRDLLGYEGALMSLLLEPQHFCRIARARRWSTTSACGRRQAAIRYNHRRHDR